MELADKLPPQAHRAFLPLIEAEYYLEQLQEYNFEVFNKNLNKPSFMAVPYRMALAAPKGRFTHRDLKYYQ